MEEKINCIEEIIRLKKRKIENNKAFGLTSINLQEDEKLLNYIEDLQQRIDKANELLSKIVVCERTDGNWGAVKNTSKQNVYKTIWKLYEILDTSSYERNEMLKILGDKE